MLSGLTCRFNYCTEIRAEIVLNQSGCSFGSLTGEPSTVLVQLGTKTVSPAGLRGRPLCSHQTHPMLAEIMQALMLVVHTKNVKRSSRHSLSNRPIVCVHHHD